MENMAIILVIDSKDKFMPENVCLFDQNLRNRNTPIFMQKELVTQKYTQDYCEI